VTYNIPNKTREHKAHCLLLASLTTAVDRRRFVIPTLPLKANAVVVCHHPPMPLLPPPPPTAATDLLLPLSATIVVVLVIVVGPRGGFMSSGCWTAVLLPTTATIDWNHPWDDIASANSGPDKMKSQSNLSGKK
jgi:hypothetical protein